MPFLLFGIAAAIGTVASGIRRARGTGLLSGIVVVAGGVVMARVFRVARRMLDVVLTWHLYYRYSLERFRAYRDERGFFLYLPVDFRDNTFAVVSQEFAAPGNHHWHLHSNLSQVLALALVDFGRVLYLGREALDVSGRGRPGRRMHRSREAGGTRCGMRGTSATQLFVAPGDSPSVVEELPVLLNGELARRKQWLFCAPRIPKANVSSSGRCSSNTWPSRM